MIGAVGSFGGARAIGTSARQSRQTETVDTVLGAVLVAIGLVVIGARRPIADRLHQDRWPFGNVYGLRLLNPLMTSPWVAAVWGTGAIALGVFMIVG